MFIGLRMLSQWYQCKRAGANLLQAQTMQNLQHILAAAKKNKPVTRVRDPAGGVIVELTEENSKLCQPRCVSLSHVVLIWYQLNNTQLCTVCTACPWKDWTASRGRECADVEGKVYRAAGTHREPPEISVSKIRLGSRILLTEQI
jgi:hypothetical protein